jgi:hypothetical protein
LLVYYYHLLLVYSPHLLLVKCSHLWLSVGRRATILRRRRWIGCRLRWRWIRCWSIMGFIWWIYKTWRNKMLSKRLILLNINKVHRIGGVKYCIPQWVNFLLWNIYVDCGFQNIAYIVLKDHNCMFVEILITHY